LPATARDSHHQVTHRPAEDADVGSPTPTLTLSEPVDRSAVTALAIAPPASGHLVLDPRRTALDLWNQVIGCRLNQRGKGPAAPYAPVAIAKQDRGKSLSAVQAADGRLAGHPTMVPDPTDAGWERAARQIADAVQLGD